MNPVHLLHDASANTSGRQESDRPSLSPTSKRRRVDRSSSRTEPSSGPRPTQRAPKSCLECSRRKIKCDKTQPCRACIERGEAAECRREAVFVKGAILGGDLSQKAISLEGLAKEVELLKQKVATLEASGGTRVEDKRNGDNIEAESSTSASRRSIGEVDQGRLPGTMEEMALGIGESTRWKGATLLAAPHDDSPTPTVQWYQPVGFETSLSALPSQLNCRTLVDFYLEEVAWIACTVHGPTFIAEHEAFWEKMQRNELKDDLWLGLLFAVICMAAFFMDEDQAAARGFSFPHLAAVATAWFDNAIATIFRCGVWKRPAFITCQVIQTLGPAFHLTSNTSLHVSLTALERAQMRSVNLHLLGSHKEDRQADLMKMELGRRVWWNNVETDWGFIPYNRFAYIAPHHFTTAMPEISDESSPASDGRISISYRSACYKSARLIYDVYGHLGPSSDPSYDKVLAASDALTALRNDLPADLRLDQQEDTPPGFCPMPSTRRRLLALTLAYRSYQIHRLFFVRSLTDPKYAPSRRACLEAADTIIAVAHFGLPRVYLQLWNVTVTFVVAGIILSLHLLQVAQTSPTAPGLVEPRLRIETLLNRLRTLDDRSGIASRGAVFITYLLQVEAEISSGQRTEVKFTRESMLELVRAERDGSVPLTALSIGSHVDPVRSTFIADNHATAMEHDPMAYGGEGIPAFPQNPEFDFVALFNDFIATA